MFDQLFTDEQYRELHRSGPMRVERERYLSHLLDEGRAISTLQLIALQLFRAAKLLTLKPGAQATEAALGRMREKWMAECPQSGFKGDPNPQYVDWFVTTTRRWLLFIGRMQTTRAHEPFAGLFEEFIESCRAERGLAEATLARYSRTLRPFLKWCNTRVRGRLRSLKAKHLDAYLQQPGCAKWSRATIACHVASIRVLLRWLGCHGYCAPELADCIRAPRLYTHERYPVGPTWSQVRELIDSVGTKNAGSLRDRAMLLLFAVYGLRGGEVRGLKLDDIDWENAVIRPSRPKQRRVGSYPLSQPVGDAIIAYLKVRPACRCRAVFVTERQPFRPLSQAGLGTMVRNRQMAMGQKLRRYGPHGLRHACATYLLAEGFTLKRIGDHLGHTMIRATEAYAKVDLKALAEVGDVVFPELMECDRRCAAEATPLCESGSMDGLRMVADVALGGLL